MSWTAGIGQGSRFTLIQRMRLASRAILANGEKTKNEPTNHPPDPSSTSQLATRNFRDRTCERPYYPSLRSAYETADENRGRMKQFSARSGMEKRVVHQLW